jgi:hypothetical protein
VAKEQGAPVAALIPSGRPHAMRWRLGQDATAWVEEVGAPKHDYIHISLSVYILSVCFILIL